MRFRIVLVAAVLLSTTMAGAPAANATAPDVCFGQGVATTPPVYHIGFGPSAAGSFTITFVAGGCAFHYFHITGTYTTNPVGNYCQVATGTGTVDGHHPFIFQMLGDMMVLAGNASGVLLFTANSLAGQSCVTGATQFLVTGAVSLV